MLWPALLLVWLVAYLIWLREPTHRWLRKKLGMGKGKP